MMKSNSDVDASGVRDTGIRLKGHEGTFRAVRKSGEYALLESEKYGRRAYMVLLKGGKVIARDIEGMSDPRVAKAMGAYHGRSRRSRSGRTMKYGYGDYLSEDDAVALNVMRESLNAYARMVKNNIDVINNATFDIENTFPRIGAFMDKFGDVELNAEIEGFENYVAEGMRSVRNAFDTRDFEDRVLAIDHHITEFIKGVGYYMPEPRDVAEPIEDADYNIDDYALKSAKAMTRKSRAKKDGDGKGNAITSGPDEPIPSFGDEAEAGKGDKGGADAESPDEPIPSFGDEAEAGKGDKGGADDIEALEPKRGPQTVSVDEDIEKMIARKQGGGDAIPFASDVPGRTQPYANNYRTVQMGEGKDKVTVGRK